MSHFHFKAAQTASLSMGSIIPLWSSLLPESAHTSSQVLCLFQRGRLSQILLPITAQESEGMHSSHNTVPQSHRRCPPYCLVNNCEPLRQDNHASLILGPPDPPCPDRVPVCFHVYILENFCLPGSQHVKSSMRAQVMLYLALCLP